MIPSISDILIVTIALTAIVFIIAITSVRIIDDGNVVLITRLGKYSRTLVGGVNWIIPFIEDIAFEETLREKILEIEPQNAFTKDNISLEVDAVIYWKIVNVKKAYYSVENIEEAIRKLVQTTLRSTIGKLTLEQTYSSRDKINQEISAELEETTSKWGVEVTLVEVANIILPKTVRDSLEQERAAESRKRATMLELEATTISLQKILEVLKTDPQAQDALRFLLGQRYLQANEVIGKSDNSKILFMDPKSLSEAMNSLLEDPSGEVSAAPKPPRPPAPD